VRDLLLFIADLPLYLQPLLSDLLNFLLFHFPPREALILLDATLAVLVQFLNVGLLRLEADFVLLCTDTRLPRLLLLCEHGHLADSLLFKSMLLLHTVNSILRVLSTHIIVLHFFDLGADSLFIFFA